MPRVGRIVVPGGPHRITQRGNGRQDAARTPDRRWRRLAVEDDAEQLRHLRAHTHTGWPLGADTFLAWLESLAGRRMRARTRGRPRKGRVEGE